MSWFESLILGLVQGLTEFLPVSSSAHLRLTAAFSGWEDPGAAFTAITQIGTETAVLIYFRKDIVRIVSAWTRSLVNRAMRDDHDARMGWLVIAGSIPIGLLGVTLKDQIEGPFRDLLGKPLVGAFHHGAQPIDPGVFRDDDGRYYLLYGGWGHLVIARLKPDFTGLEPLADGTVFKEITPAPEYVEGPLMFKRNGKYYFMWSEGGWTGPDYSVAYAIGDSPTGPFKRIGKVLQQDPAIATGAGHHSVFHVAKDDTWYIVYHRRPLGDTQANHRETAIDRMVFDKDGRSFVYVALGRRAVPREVVLGPSNADFVVVEKGLARGERVCLRDPEAPPSDFGSLTSE